MNQQSQIAGVENAGTNVLNTEQNALSVPMPEAAASTSASAAPNADGEVFVFDEDETLAKKVARLRARHATLNDQEGVTERDRLVAMLEAYQVYRGVGGSASADLTKLLETNKVDAKARKNSALPYVYLFTGWQYKSKDADRQQRTRKRASFYATLWDATDAALPGATVPAITAIQAWITGQGGVDKAVDAYVSARKDAKKPPVSPETEQDAAEVNEVNEAWQRAPLLCKVDTAAAADVAAALNVDRLPDEFAAAVRINSLNEFEVRPVFMPYTNGLLPFKQHFRPAKTTFDDARLAAIAEWYGLGAKIIPEGNSSTPRVASEDPKAASTQMASASRYYAISANADMVTMSQGRTEASVVLQATLARPFPLRSNMVHFVDNSLRRHFEKLLNNPERRNYAYLSQSSQANADGENTAVILNFGVKDDATVKRVNLWLRPLTHFGHSPDLDLWAWEISQAYKPCAARSLDLNAIALLQKEFVAKAKPGTAAEKRVVKVTLDKDAVSLGLEKGKPLSLPVTAAASGKAVTVEVRGVDLLSVLREVVARKLTGTLDWHADKEGLLEVAFGLHHARYRAFIPTLMSGSTTMRRDKLLNKVSRTDIAA